MDAKWWWIGGGAALGITGIGVGIYLASRTSPALTITVTKSVPESMAPVTVTQPVPVTRTVPVTVTRTVPVTVPVTVTVTQTVVNHSQSTVSAAPSVSLAGPSTAPLNQLTAYTATVQGLANPIFQFEYRLLPEQYFLGMGGLTSSSTGKIVLNSPGTWQIVVYASEAGSATKVWSNVVSTTVS